jgi:hypothetical protein
MKRPFLLPAALLLAGCAGTLEYPGTTDFTVDPAFAKRRPAEVSVLPAAGNLSEDAAAALREAVRARLLDLHYAPVRLKEIDRAPQDYKPGGAHPVLEILVEKWDDAGLFGDGTVRVTGEVRLFGAASRDVLYRGRLSDVPVQASFVARTMEERGRTLEQAATEAAERFLEKLPLKGD